MTVQSAGCMNEAGVNPSLEFTQRLASAIRSARIFSAVYEPGSANSAPMESARLRLEVHESAQPDQGAFFKGFLIGLSLYVLTPALPFHVEGQYVMKATVTLADGTSRTYRLEPKETYLLRSSTLVRSRGRSWT